MPRYFIEVAYKGTDYAGFQVQKNANTIQAEVENALQTFYRQHFELTGSSRTDAGVHALQNFFHFDSDVIIAHAHKTVYHINAILPDGIVLKKIMQVADDAHCRFDAVSRSYEYHIYRLKNPFIGDRAYYYPYTIDADLLHEAAGMLGEYRNFQSFSKKNTQVTTHDCHIMKSNWTFTEDGAVYRVTGNRFLRGMVRGLVGTMLMVGRGKYSLEKFRDIIESRNASATDFSVPARGLFLVSVKY